MSVLVVLCGKSAANSESSLLFLQLVLYLSGSPWLWFSCEIMGTCQSPLLCINIKWLVSFFCTHIFILWELICRSSACAPQGSVRCLSSTNSLSLSSSLIFHRQTLPAKSFNKCSGFYDDYECNTQYYINSLKKLLFTVLHISVAVNQRLFGPQKTRKISWEMFPSKVGTKRLICVH